MAPFDLSIHNQAQNLEDYIKLYFYDKMYDLSNTTKWMRISGPLIGIASGVLTLAAKIALIAEIIIKGLINIFGAPFFKNCRLFTGLNQLGPKLGIQLLQLPCTILSALLSPFTKTIFVANNPQRYFANKLFNHDLIAQKEFNSQQHQDERERYLEKYLESYLARKAKEYALAKERAQADEAIRSFSASGTKWTITPDTTSSSQNDDDVTEAIRFIQQQNLAEEHSEKSNGYLQLIANKGFSIESDETGRMAKCNILRLNASVEEVLKALPDPPQVSNIEIQFSPSNSIKKENLHHFLKQYGAKISTLQLNQYRVNSKETMDIISYCQNIKALSIRGSKIVTLPLLLQLETLDCSDCKMLKNLPDLPKLHYFEHRGCQKLQLPPLSSDLTFILILFALGKDSATLALKFAALNGIDKLPLLLAAYRNAIPKEMKQTLTDVKTLNNIELLEKIDQFKTVAALFPSLKQFAQFLSEIDLTKEYETDSIACDYTSIKEDITLSCSLIGTPEELLHFPRQTAESFCTKPFGRYIIKTYKKEFLENPKLQKFLLKAYPPPEFREIYPIEKEFKNHSLTLKILPNHPLVDPDAILTLFDEFEPNIKSIDSLFVKHYAGEGIDRGAPSRQFFSHTLMGICKHSAILTFEKPTNVFELGWGLRPTTKGQLISEEEKKYYIKLGNFLGLALRLKSPIGLLFSEKLFGRILFFNDALLNLKQVSLNTLFFSSNAKNALSNENIQQFISTLSNLIEPEPQFLMMMDLYKKALLSSDEKIVRNAAQQLAMITSYDPLPVVEQGAIAALQEEVRNLLFLYVNENLMKHFEIAFCLAKGIRKVLPFQIENHQLVKWNELKSLKLEWAFSRAIQGTLNAEDLKDNLTVEAISEEVSPKIVEQVKNIIFHWIDDHQDDIQGLSNFLATFTGASALFKTILFIITPEVENIEIHACFNEIHIPYNIKMEFLKSYLDSAAQDPSSEFNIN